ncbi:MAG: PilZ domain-containing protein [Candidatus Omnitrophica bacterium]|nr:PilZ domain-containing protein [Candidatus Omnitrophota bacterium]
MTQTSQGSDKRRHPRFTLTLPLEINGPDFHVATSTMNVSCGGVFCETEHFLPLGTEVKITMRLSFYVQNQKVRKTVSCSAKVARVEPPEDKGLGKYTIGISFVRLDAHDKEVLREFIHKKNLREAQELKKMYLTLKEMAGRLVELEECHPTAEHFRRVVNRSIIELDTVAHVLDHEISELIRLE